MIHTCLEFSENISDKCASKQNINDDPYSNGWILANAIVYTNIQCS